MSISSGKAGSRGLRNARLIAKWENTAQFLGVSIRTAHPYHQVLRLPIDKFGTKTVYLDVEKFDEWKKETKEEVSIICENRALIHHTLIGHVMIVC